VYLSPAVDLFDGDVAAFSVGTSPSKALVAEMLAGAVAAAGGGGREVVQVAAGVDQQQVGRRRAALLAGVGAVAGRPRGAG
ncbi:hypothetical protein C1850_11485, partial [Adlercreutzia equolifaciens subsp. celatus]